MSISETITAKNNNKPVTLRALVTGRADNTYTVPSDFLLSCGKCKKAACHSGNDAKLTLPRTDLLKFADVSERSFHKIIQALSGAICANFSYSISKTASLLRIFLSDPAAK